MIAILMVLLRLVLSAKIMKGLTLIGRLLILSVRTELRVAQHIELNVLR